jgi:hypothetical protein
MSGASPKMSDKDRLKQVDEDSIIQTIVQLMNKVECVLDMSGIDKKNYVLNETRKLLGLEVYERYSYFIITFIDFVVDVSKGNSGIELNKIKKKFNCCY